MFKWIKKLNQKNRIVRSIFNRVIKRSMLQFPTCNVKTGKVIKAKLNLCIKHYNEYDLNTATKIKTKLHINLEITIKNRCYGYDSHGSYLYEYGITRY